MSGKGAIYNVVQGIVPACEHPHSEIPASKTSAAPKSYYSQMIIETRISTSDPNYSPLEIN